MTEKNSDANTIPQDHTAKMAIACAVYPMTLITWSAVLIWLILLGAPQTHDIALSLWEYVPNWTIAVLIALTILMTALEGFLQNFPSYEKCPHCGSYIGWRHSNLHKGDKTIIRQCLLCETVKTDHVSL